MEHALAAAAFDAAIKALSDFPTFYYDARTGRYHSAATKKMVSFDAIQAVFHAKEAFDGERLTKIALAYKRGNLPANLWYQATLDQLRKWHIQQAALGAGGFGRLRPADYERIEQLLNEDRPRLERFARQIPTMGDGQIQYRINLYLGNGRRNYWRAKRLPSQARKPGYTVIERRVIQPGDNCFVAGTLISTPNGDVPIEQIREGQLVSTRFGPKRVVKCMTHMAQRSALVTVQTIGGSVVCTNNHPFLTTSGWVKAGKLGRNRIAVFSQDGTQQFRAQVTFPYAYYSEATSGEIGVLRRVALFLLQLTRAQRLEAGMPVPPFTINLNDEVAHLGIYNEFGLDEVVRFIGDVELVKVGEQPQFETGGFAALPLTHRLEQIGKALWVLPTALRFLAHSLCRTGQMGWIVGQHALGSSNTSIVRGDSGVERQAEFFGAFPQAAIGGMQFLRTELQAINRVVFSNKSIFFLGKSWWSANQTFAGWKFNTLSTAFSRIGFLVPTFWTHFKTRINPAIQADFRFNALFPAAVRADSISAFKASSVSSVSQATTADITEARGFWGRHNSAPLQSNNYELNTSVPDYVQVYNFEVEDVHEYLVKGDESNSWYFVVHNCEWCIHLADFGWQVYGVLPYPGEIDQSWYGHACLTNCRCKLERRYIKTANVGKYVKRPFMVAAYDPVEHGKAYEESEHPRYPKGNPKAGKWMPKNGVPEAGTLQGLAYEVDPTKTPLGYMDLSDAKWERVKAHGITNFFFKVTAKDGKQYFAKALPVQKEALEREVFNHDVLTAFGFKAIEFGVTDLPDSVFKELKLRPEIWEGRGTEFAPMIVFPYMDTSGEAELQPLAAASGRFPAHGGNWNNMPIEEKMKLVVADFAIGNPDRHNDNIMVPIPDATENWEEAGAWSAQDLFLIDNAFFDPTDEFTQGRRRMGHTAILNGWEGGLDDPMESYGESQLDVPFADILADMEAAVADKPSDENWNYVRRGLHAMRYAFEPGATPYGMLYLLEGIDLAEARGELTGYDPAQIESLVDIWREAQESGEGDWKAYEESQNPRLDQNDEFSSAVTYDTARAGQNVIEDTKPESEVGKAFDSNQPRYPKGDPEGRGGQWKPDSEPVPLIAREPVTYSPPRPDFDDFNIEDQPDPGLHMPRFGVEFVDSEPPMVITPVDRSVLDSRFDAWIAKGKQEFGYPIGAVDLTKAKWEPINSSSMTGELYTVTEQDGTKWFVKGFNGDEQTTLDRELTNYTILKQSGFPVLPFGVTDNPNNPGFRLMAFPHLGDFDMFPMAHLGNSRRLQVLRAMAPETPLHVVAVDFALGNWDRHAGNVMVGRTGDWLLIDNAYVDNGAFDGLQRSAGRSAFITPFRTMPEQPEESAPLPPALVENIERMASMELPEAMRPDQRMFWGYGVAFARFSARRSHTQGAFVRMMRAYSKWEVGEISRRQGLTPDAVRFFMQMKDHDENAKIDMDWKRYDEGGELWDILQSLEGLPVLKSSEELSPIDD